MPSSKVRWNFLAVSSGHPSRLSTTTTFVHPSNGHHLKGPAMKCTLLYTDDIMLTATTRQDRQQQVQKWSDPPHHLWTSSELKGICVFRNSFYPLNCFRSTIKTWKRLRTSSTLPTICRKNAGSAVMCEQEWMQLWYNGKNHRCAVWQIWICLKLSFYKTVILPVGLYVTKCWKSTNTSGNFDFSLFNHITNDCIR